MQTSLISALTASALFIAASVRIVAAEDATAAQKAAEIHFDKAVFGNKSGNSIETTQRRLHQKLAKRIAAIDRCCGLDEAQKKKLELAGKGSIKQLIRSIDELKREFLSSDLNDEQKIFKFVNEDAIGLQLRSGPFNEDSLFAKTLRNVLTPEQADKYDRRAALAAASNKPISVANAGDLLRIATTDKNVYQIVWSPDRQRLAFVEFNNSVEIYAPPSEKVVRVFGEGKKVVGFDFNSDPSVVAIGENSNNATIININEGSEIQIDTNQPQPSVKFSPDGRSLATGGYGKEAKLWSTSTGEFIREFHVGPGEGGLTPVFSPDGEILAVGHRNSTTRLFDVASGKILHTLPWSMSQGLSFDPTGKYLAVTYVDGRLAVWDVQTGKLKSSVQSAADELYTVDWSPDGSLLVSAGRNSQVTIWNAIDLSVLNELESPDWVISTKFSPDGTKLLFAGGGQMRRTGRYVETWAVP